jgi:hypothetical protein
MRSSKVSRHKRSKLKWPSLLCQFQIKEEDPTKRHQEGAEEWENQLQKLNQMDKSDKQDLHLHPKHEKGPS